MSFHAYWSSNWRILGRARLTAFMSTEPLSPKRQKDLILWRSLNASSQPFDNSNSSWLGCKRSKIFAAFSLMRSPKIGMRYWFARIHSASVSSIVGNLTIYWRLLWMLGSSSRLSSSVERFRVWEIVGSLTSMLCSDLSQRWSSACESVRLHFLWLHKTMRTSSVIVVYFLPFFGMVGCWGRASTCVCVCGGVLTKKQPSWRFQPLVSNLSLPFP